MRDRQGLSETTGSAACFAGAGTNRVSCETPRPLKIIFLVVSPGVSPGLIYSGRGPRISAHGRELGGFAASRTFIQNAYRAGRAAEGGLCA